MIPNKGLTSSLLSRISIKMGWRVFIEGSTFCDSGLTPHWWGKSSTRPQGWASTRLFLRVSTRPTRRKDRVSYSFIIETLSFFQKAYCASIAGFIGALFANPADLALIRMQADNQLPLAERRNYKNVFHAFATITKEDGFTGLWRGGVPTVVRAVILNLTMLATYDEAKEAVLHKLGTKQETLEVRIM